MSENKVAEHISHELIMSDRKHLSVSGVCEVLSFDDNTVALKTVCGELNIEGEGLRVSELDTNKGNVVLDGSIQSVIYYDTVNETRRGLFGRFR